MGGGFVGFAFVTGSSTKKVIEEIIKLTELVTTNVFGTELKGNLSGVEELVGFDNNFM